MVQEKMKANRKLVYLILITVIVVFFVSLVLYKSSSNKPTMLINTVPEDAKVLVNGETYSQKKTYPDNKVYNIEVTREGFKSIKQTVKLSSEQKTFYFALTPSSKDAEEWAEKNSDEYSKIEEQGAIEAQEQGEKLQNNNPLLSHLPIENLLFRIDYGVNTSGQNIVIISADSPLNRAYALKQIENLGYHPHDYRITFGSINKNPFTGESNE